MAYIVCTCDRCLSECDGATPSCGDFYKPKPTGAMERLRKYLETQIADKQDEMAEMRGELVALRNTLSALTAFKE